MTLRPYQRDAVEAVYEHLRTRDDNPCVVLPTAAGKTPIIATICRDAVQLWNGRVLILAHVRELLEQAAEKLRCVAPDLPFGIYSAGLKRRDLGYPVTIAGIQSVYQRGADVGAVDLVIVDECFVVGTRISTPAGDVPIEMIQPGAFVRNATGIGQVIATSAKVPEQLLTLEYSDGTRITCTPNHPIFTATGWKQAGALEVGSLAFGLESMRVLREIISAVDQATAGRSPTNSERKVLAEAAILLDLLLQDPQQLHEIVGSPQEGQRHAEDYWPRAEAARWKRTANRTAEEASKTAGRRLDCRVHSPGAELQTASSAQALEDRHRTTRPDDCHRTGWPEPSIAEASLAGFSQDDFPGAKRLVRISRHKSVGERVVVNLHVAGHPSFFANGVLVHNCHLISEDGEGMYRQFLSEMQRINPQVRVIGLTATPFRMKSGMICAPENVLNAVCYEIGVRELIVQGYLCPLRSKAGTRKPNVDELHVRGGEYVAGEVEALMDADELVRSACREIVAHTGDRHSVLIFASGVRHGQHIADVLQRKHGAECGFVCGETLPFERDETLRRFRDGDLKYLCNVNVLTTGFDAPNIDCVALVRPTLSPGLYLQMVGRGFRLHPGKSDCLVLDFGGNVLRHGPVDALRIDEPPSSGQGEAPAKECPQCHELIAAGYATCPACGFVFPPPQRTQHEGTASEAGVLSDQVTRTEHEVQEIFYAVHGKRGAPPEAPRTLRVDYRIGFNQYVSEWVCVEHDGYARQKAEQWWRRRSYEPVPDTAAQAVELAEMGALAAAEAITVLHKPSEQFDRIVAYRLGEKPPRPESAEDLPAYVPPIDESEIPF